MFSEMQVIGQVHTYCIVMMMCYIIYMQFNLGFIICKLGSDLFIVDQVVASYQRIIS